MLNVSVIDKSMKTKQNREALDDQSVGTGWGTELRTDLAENRYWKVSRQSSFKEKADALALCVLNLK